MIGAWPGRSAAPIARLLPAVLLAACTSTSPSPTPADTQVIFEELARRGATVTSIVSGDPGCDEPELIDNAVSFDLRGRETEAPARVHLLIFRNAAAHAAAEAAFQRCGATLERAATRPVESGGSSPYRFLAEGLSQADRQLIEEAIEALR